MGYSLWGCKELDTNEQLNYLHHVLKHLMVWFWSQSFCSDLQHHLWESTQLHLFCLMEEMEPPSVCAWGNSGRPREVWDLGNSVTPALFQLDLVPLRGLGLEWGDGTYISE